MLVGVYKLPSSRGVSVVSSDSLCEVNRADPTRLRVCASRYDFFCERIIVITLADCVVSASVLRGRASL